MKPHGFHDLCPRPFRPSKNDWLWCIRRFSVVGASGPMFGASMACFAKADNPCHVHVSNGAIVRNHMTLQRASNECRRCRVAPMQNFARALYIVSDTAKSSHLRCHVSPRRIAGVGKTTSPLQTQCCHLTRSAGRADPRHDRPLDD
jgi:hypothetical protein